MFSGFGTGLLYKEEEDKGLKKIFLNKEYLAKKATASTTAMFALLGLIGTFFSLSDIISDNLKIGIKFIIAISIVVLVWILCFIFHSYIFYKKKWIKVFDAGNNHHVYVQYGDLFSEDEIDSQNTKRNIVIPVNRCFDTEVNDRIISKKTIHGVAFAKLYKKGCYTAETLNDAIQHDLTVRQELSSVILNSTEKSAGNILRYDVGTVAQIEDDNSQLFLLGLSSFDKNLTAHTTDQEYALALVRLIEYCYNNAQGYPVVMPLIGAGLSRTKKEERALLEYIVKSLKLHKALLQFDVHIVVRDSGKETIAITEL